jgi:hypothetical protein
MEGSGPCRVRQVLPSRDLLAYPRNLRKTGPYGQRSRASGALVRAGEVPWFDYRIQFADVFAAGGFDLVMCGVASNMPGPAAPPMEGGPVAPRGGGHIFLPALLFLLVQCLPVTWG